MEVKPVGYVGCENVNFNFLSVQEESFRSSLKWKWHQRNLNTLLSLRVVSLHVISNREPTQDIFNRESKRYCSLNELFINIHDLIMISLQICIFLQTFIRGQAISTTTKPALILFPDSYSQPHCLIDGGLMGRAAVFQGRDGEKLWVYWIIPAVDQISFTDSVTVQVKVTSLSTGSGLTNHTLWKNPENLLFWNRPQKSLCKRCTAWTVCIMFDVCWQARNS